MNHLHLLKKRIPYNPSLATQSAAAVHAKVGNGNFAAEATVEVDLNENLGKKGPESDTETGAQRVAAESNRQLE